MFSVQYALDEPLPLAELAYGGASPALPAGWSLVAPIEPQSFGFVGLNMPRPTAFGGGMRRTVAVSICGTRDLDQWLHDFDARVMTNPFGPGLVHVGFMQEYLAVRASIWKALESVGYDELIITGHSLGGPMAVYCAADIAKNAPQYAARITGYTFESPKPGDSEFVADFNQKYPNWWRIQNIRDIIPTLPPPPIFTEHEGTTIWVDGGHPPLGESYLHWTHGLETGVRPGLVKLVQDATVKTGGKV